MGNEWMTTELASLRSQCNGGLDHVASILVRHPRGSIQVKAREIGVMFPGSKPEWSAEDSAELRHMVACGVSAQRIAEYFGRTKKAVTNKVSREREKDPGYPQLRRQRCERGEA